MTRLLLIKLLGKEKGIWFRNNKDLSPLSKLMRRQCQYKACISSVLCSLFRDPLPYNFAYLLIVALICLQLPIKFSEFNVQRRPPEAPVRIGVLERVDNIKRGRGRPKLTWDELVKRDLKDWNISKEIALNRSAWRLAINVSEL